MSHPQLASCYRYRFKFEALEHGSAMSAMGPVLHYIRAADRLVTEETLAKSDSSNRVCASPNKSWAPRVSIRNTSDALSRRPFWPSSRPQGLRPFVSPVGATWEFYFGAFGEFSPVNGRRKPHGGIAAA